MSIRVTVIGGVPAPLTWLAEVTIPPMVEVEVVDFGRRLDLIVTRNDEELSAVADLLTDERVIGGNSAEGSLLEGFAMGLVDARKRTYDMEASQIVRSDNDADAGGEGLPLALPDYLAFGAVRWPSQGRNVTEPTTPTGPT